MAKPTEKYRDVSFVELIRFIKYLEEHYGAVAEIHISTDEDGTLDALLCITCIGCCKVHRDPGHNTFASRKVAYQQLHTVPAVLLDMFYEICDRIDGRCPHCLAVQAVLN